MSTVFTLYSFADFDRSARVRWLLHELGLPLREVRLNYREGEHLAATYREKNPFGLVPTLEEPGGCIFDSGAILSLLLERYPDSDLAPPPGSPTRADYLQWFFFGATTLDSAAFRMIRLLMVDKRDTDEWADGLRRIKVLLEALSNRLSDRDYLAGEQFSVADLMVGFDLGILERLNLLTDYPIVKRFHTKLSERSAAVEARVFSSPLPFG